MDELSADNKREPLRLTLSEQFSAENTALIAATGAQGPLAVHIVIGEKPLLVLFGYGPKNALLERLLESDR